MERFRVEMESSAHTVAQVPEQLVRISVVSVCASASGHVVCRSENGALYGFGRNAEGQCGVGECTASVESLKRMVDSEG